MLEHLLTKDITSRSLTLLGKVHSNFFIYSNFPP